MNKISVLPFAQLQRENRFSQMMAPAVHSTAVTKPFRLDSTRQSKASAHYFGHNFAVNVWKSEKQFFHLTRHRNRFQGGSYQREVNRKSLWNSEIKVEFQRLTIAIVNAQKSECSL